MVEPKKIPGLEEPEKNVYFMAYRNMSLPDETANGMKIFRQSLMKEIENAVVRGKKTFVVQGESLADLFFGNIVLAVKADLAHDVKLMVLYVTARRRQFEYSRYNKAWEELERKADYVCSLYPDTINQIMAKYDHYMIQHVSEVICYIQPGRQRRSRIAKLCARDQIPLHNIFTDEMFAHRFQQQSRSIQSALKRLITEANENKGYRNLDAQKTTLREAMQETDNTDDLKSLVKQYFILEQKQKTSFQEFILSRGEEIINPDLTCKLKEFETRQRNCPA